MSTKIKIYLTLSAVLILFIGSFIIFRVQISNILVDRAKTSMYNGNLSSAKQYLNMAKLISNNNANLSFAEGNVALLEKKYEEAESYFTAALSYNFEPRQYPLIKLADCYYLIDKNYGKALPLYLELDKIKPEDLITNRRLAAIYFNMGSFKDSITYATGSISLIEANHYNISDFSSTSTKDVLLADSYALIGHSSYLLKNYQKAVDAYKKSLDLNPNQSIVITRYARALKSIGDTKGAINELNKLLSANPNYQPALCALAGVYVKTSDYDKAIETAGKATSNKKITSSNISCLYNSAAAYYKTGNSIKAKEDLLNLLDNLGKLSLVGPEYQDLKKSAEDLLAKIK